MSQLVEAVWAEDRQKVQDLLAAGADPNGPYDDGIPLQWACHAGNLDLMRLLIESGADIETRNPHGFSALHVASIVSPEAVHLLISRGADVNAANDDGMTPIMMASKAGHIRSVRMLLEHGADPNLVDEKGRNAAYWAKVGRQDDVVQLLSAYGADTGRLPDDLTDRPAGF